MDSGVTIKLLHTQIEAICNIYKRLTVDFEPENNYEKVLFEHIIALYDKVYMMHGRGQAKYNLQMKGPEAVAFFMLWTDAGLALNNYYESIVINEMISKIGSKRNITSKLLK